MRLSLAAVAHGAITVLLQDAKAHHQLHASEVTLVIVIARRGVAGAQLHVLGNGAVGLWPRAVAHSPPVYLVAISLYDGSLSAAPGSLEDEGRTLVRPRW